jgi:hypothetical protein
MAMPISEGSHFKFDARYTAKKGPRPVATSAAEKLSQFRQFRLLAFEGVGFSILLAVVALPGIKTKLEGKCLSTGSDMRKN